MRRDGRALGQGLVEYGLILALTGGFSAIILGVFGSAVADVLSTIGTIIDTATRGG